MMKSPLLALTGALLLCLSSACAPVWETSSEVGAGDAATETAAKGHAANDEHGGGAPASEHSGHGAPAAGHDDHSAGDGHTANDDHSAGDGHTANDDHTHEADTKAVTGAVKRMTQAYEDMLLREEHRDMDVGLKHVLLTFDGVHSEYYINPRSKEEAEQLAAECYQRLVDGERIDDMVKMSDDQFYPSYTVSAASRYELAKGFGDILWRLQPGEFAPLLYEKVLSPYGWHLIFRTH